MAAAKAPPIELAAELVDLQALLALWRRAWRSAANPTPCAAASWQRKRGEWADQVMRHVAEDVR
ncbi:hypothetical protein [Candidatus Amarolinea dominans]|uniref:hypothetical protein n=1 Tax=Candidatus Amarolinea dominans TaxID=3140696 RepID=UPI0031347858|nr:hypothetical protein [Anaerolineae bacterium]